MSICKYNIPAGLLTWLSTIKSMTSWNLQTHLGSAISKQQVYRAEHAGISYLFYHTKPRMISTWLRFCYFLQIKALVIFFIVVLNTNIIPVLKAAFCSGLFCISPRVGILKASRPQQYRESWNGTLATGANVSSPWQRVLIRWMVTAVKEPTETQVANSLDTWLSSNRIRVFSREV